MTLALPAFGTRSALRYVQLLDGTGPQLVEVNPIPIPRRPLSDRKFDSLFAWSETNLKRIFAERHRRDIEEISQQAARVAYGLACIHGMGRFPDYFRAELQRLPLLDKGLIDYLVGQARGHIDAGRVPFDEAVMLLK